MTHLTYVGGEACRSCGPIRFRPDRFCYSTVVLFSIFSSWIQPPAIGRRQCAETDSTRLQITAGPGRKLSLRGSTQSSIAQQDRWLSVAGSHIPGARRVLGEIDTGDGQVRVN